MQIICVCSVKESNEKQKAPKEICSARAETKVKSRKMAAKPEDKSTDIPDRLFDSNTRKTYKRMRFFGKVSVNHVERSSMCSVGLQEYLAPPAQISVAAAFLFPCAPHSCCCFCSCMQLYAYKCAYACTYVYDHTHWQCCKTLK